MRLLPVLVVGSLSLFATAAGAATTTCSSVAACVMGTNSSSGPGVGGTSKTGFGVSGISTSGHAVNGASSTGFGVVGTTAVNATSSGAARAGVFGEDLSTKGSAPNSGVAGSSTNGYGGSFSSKNGLGLYVDGGAVITTPRAIMGDGGDTYYSTLSSYAPSYDNNSEPEGDVFEGYGCSIDPTDPVPGCSETSYIDSTGEAHFQAVTAEGFTSDVRRSNGSYVKAFGARSTSPTIEDFGTAKMLNGVAYVALEKTFKSTISPGYMVFVTPHGDSNSLYTLPGGDGFYVRESKGGHSTVTFDYRIVAKPVDQKTERLPAMAPRRAAKRTAPPRSTF